MRARLVVIGIAFAVVAVAGMLFRLRVMIAGGRFLLVLIAVIVVLALLAGAGGSDDRA